MHHGLVFTTSLDAPYVHVYFPSHVHKFVGRLILKCAHYDLMLALFCTRRWTRFADLRVHVVRVPLEVSIPTVVVFEIGRSHDTTILLHLYSLVVSTFHAGWRCV